MAEAFREMEHTVTFVTTGLSLFSVIRRDIRLRTGRPLNKLVEESPRLFSYLHFTLFHPHTLILKPLNILTSSFVHRYALYSLGEAEEHIRQADVIFYESSSSICLLERMKELAPGARHVYRASDLLGMMRSLHPEVRRMEAELIPQFDMISVPISVMMRHFAGNSTVRLHEHGVNMKLFDRDYASPYEPDVKNCVFIGNAHLDYSFLDIVALAFPDVQFHIIGSVARRVRHDNIRYHGVMAFESTMAYLKHATVGLYCLHSFDSAIMETYGRSLKMKQYMYCMLPVVLPVQCVYEDSDEFFPYRFDCRSSMLSAMEHALSSPHRAEWKAKCRDWNQVAKEILDSAVECRGGESA